MSIELTPELQNVCDHTRVLRDRVLVKVLPYVHPVLATPGMQIQKGIVIGVGYGRRERRKVEFRNSMGDQVILGPNGQPAKFAQTASSNRSIWFEDGAETGRILPMQVKPGDVVEFSFRNITVVDFDRIPQFYGVGELAFIWQKAVYYIDPDPDLERVCAEALLWQQSAGYDRNGNWMSGAEDWHRA